MPAVVIIGGQWGDEGKGRTVDFHSQYCSVIARYSAGNNAGHTIMNDQGKFALHVIPAGIFRADKICVIGHGVVIDPGVVLDEIDGLEERGVSTKNLRISRNANVIMPWHPLIDRADENLRGELAIGTTGTGTGPAFHDKVARTGIRVADLLDRERFSERLKPVLDYKNRILTGLYGLEPLVYADVFETYLTYGERLRSYADDTAAIVQQAHDEGKMILLEGAQGSLLDLDTGTYPYVTSSVPASIAAGGPAGVGLGPTAVQKVIGVYKAYQTRVGNGPMPTEIFGQEAEDIRQGGGGVAGTGEFGTTTGRARRIGWFDGVLAKHTADINGITSVALTRLDTLSHADEVKICTGYEIAGISTETMPATLWGMEQAKPVYETLDGWGEDVSDVRRFSDLPKNARSFVKRIESLIGVTIDMISVGPERDQAIVTRDIFGTVIEAHQ